MGGDHDALRRSLDDPEDALGVSEEKSAGQGAAGGRPHRTIPVHDRMVFEPGPAPAMPSWPQQGVRQRTNVSVRRRRHRMLTNNPQLKGQ